MKKLLLSLFTVFAFNANAGLIDTVSDQLTYDTGDTVLVDLFINDANPSIYLLEVNYLFNDAELSFEGFSITDDVFDNSYYSDIFVDFDLLTIQLGLLADWSDILGTSFQLGQLEFTALGNNVGADFDLDSVYAEDVNFTEISAQSVQEVPEPPAIAIFALGLLALSRFKVKR